MGALRDGGGAADDAAVILDGETGVGRLTSYLGHRADREAQVHTALAAAATADAAAAAGIDGGGWRTPSQVAAAIYPPTLPPAVVTAAAAVVALHATALVEDGVVQRRDAPDAPPDGVIRGVPAAAFYASYRLAP